MDTASFRYSDRANSNRANKAKTLARFLWDRNITVAQLQQFSPAHLRRIARAAEVNPPSSMDTWNTVIELIEQKTLWLHRNPGHPAGDRHHLDDHSNWYPEPPAKTKPKTTTPKTMS